MVKRRIWDGNINNSEHNSDLAILLYQAREKSINLFGPRLEHLIAPIPLRDIQSAIKDSLPSLIASTKGDERNVILTLARMLFTL